VARRRHSPSLARPDLLTQEDLARGPQQERSERKRKDLLDAALGLFAEHGFEATTIEDIARTAGVAVGGFYRHFRSKRQALLVLMDRLIGELEGVYLDLDGAKDLRAGIEGAVRRGIVVDQRYAGAYRAWREAVLSDSSLERLNRRVEHWTQSRLQAVLRFAAAAPNARPNLDLTTLSRLLNLLFWRLAEAPKKPTERFIECLTDLIYHGLFAD
jgi:AcrR family transcriptional regulator